MSNADIIDIIADAINPTKSQMTSQAQDILTALRSAGYAVVKLPESVEKLNGDMEWCRECSHEARRVCRINGQDTGETYRFLTTGKFHKSHTAVAEKAEEK